MDSNFKNQLGRKLLKRGDCSFFLHPGESIPYGIQNVHVLGENEGLVITATEEFEENGIKKAAGDRWMIKGPCEYVPTVQSQIVERHEAIPLGKIQKILKIRNLN